MSTTAAYLPTFKGGVHPDDRKELTRDRAIENFPAPEVATVPLSQHIGAPCKPCVSKGQEVRKGTKVGEPQGFVSVPVHSPISGKVKEIATVRSPVTGKSVPAVVIESNGEDKWDDVIQPCENVEALDGDEIKNRILAAGIAGMGGATFPTHVKLSPPPEKKIDTVILNGSECEPYLTCDYRLMMEEPDKIVAGMRLIMKAVGCERGIIAIEANKPDAFECMQKAAADYKKIEVRMLQVKYPQGAEKQLICALTGREVPWHGGLPMDVGVVVQNVGTSRAVYDAVYEGKPLIERVVTVTGEGVENPANLRVRIGTPFSALLDHCGMRENVSKVIMGGPMMGLAQPDLDAPVIKGTSGLLVLADVFIEDYSSCIRCGKCVNACPVHLVPSLLSVLCEARDFDAAKEANVLECIECGCCTFVCPAKRPIVHWVKLAKADLARKRQQEKQKKS